MSRHRLQSVAHRTAVLLVAVGLLAAAGAASFHSHDADTFSLACAACVLASAPVDLSEPTAVAGLGPEPAGSAPAVSASPASPFAPAVPASRAPPACC